jgi:hypothetical protein
MGTKFLQLKRTFCCGNSSVPSEFSGEGFGFGSYVIAQNFLGTESGFEQAVFPLENFWGKNPDLGAAWSLGIFRGRNRFGDRRSYTHLFKT